MNTRPQEKGNLGWRVSWREKSCTLQILNQDNHHPDGSCFVCINNALEGV